ncbi:MAG TPA: calcium-binding protein [Nitrososphaeraceae archaeon]|nr:calcium-binding protein [Nitrososphaeraceae archaeon]
MKKIKEYKRILNVSITKNRLLNLFSIKFFMLFIVVSLFLIVTTDIFSQYRHSNIVIDVWGITEEINGTEKADNITGTVNKDNINGLDGNDNLIGKEAGDDISGGSGNDKIFGQDGRDILWGKAGNDHLEGEKGNDRLYGGRGKDVLIGGAGNDTLTGGIGKDSFSCGTGNDIIRDLNETQGDTIPQNDCENSKYSKTGDLISLQPQQNLDPNDTNNKVIEKSNPKIEVKNSDKDESFFFGLFK